MVGGVLRNMGFSNLQLMLMFYLICVVLRTAGAMFVWNYGDKLWVLVLLGLVALVGIMMNIKGLMSGKKVWWSREFHLLIAISVLVTVGISVVYVGDRSLFKKVLGMLMLLDVSVGVIISLMVRPFSG